MALSTRFPAAKLVIAGESGYRWWGEVPKTDPENPWPMLLRCQLDGLLLDAHPNPGGTVLIAWDGDEPFALERVEAAYYELAAATPPELDWLRGAGYRLLRLAPDFSFIPLKRRA